MASITIRQLPESTKRKLKLRAAERGRSMEQEAREILTAAVTGQQSGPRNSKDLVESIRRRFSRFGGVKLEIPPREPIPEPRIR